MSTTHVFITGANRGVGLSLVKIYLARPNHIVIGSVRDVAASKANSLSELPTAEGSSLVVVKIEAESFTDPALAVRDLEAQGITRLDIVIANSAIIGKEVAAVAESDPDDFAHILTVNAVGPVALFKATKPLLDRSENPKWISVSTEMSSSGSHTTAFMAMGSRPLGYGYAASKAALNHLTQHIHSENAGLTAFSLHPGFLDTDMGSAGAQLFGIEELLQQVGDNTQQIVDNATRETHSGKLLRFDGQELPW